MVSWTVKAGSPAMLDLGQELVKAISGNSGLSWLGAYIPLLGQDLVATADMCSAGPPAAGPLTAADFAQAFTPGGFFGFPKRIEQSAIALIFDTY